MVGGAFLGFHLALQSIIPETRVKAQNKIALQESAQLKSLLYDCMTTLTGPMQLEKCLKSSNLKQMPRGPLLHEAISAVHFCARPAGNVLRSPLMQHLNWSLR